MSMRICGLAFSVLCAFAGHAFAQEAESLRGWDKLADGVYQQTDARGVVTRIAYGSEGAAFERERLLTEIQRRTAAAGKRGTTDDDVEAIARLQNALDNVPLSASVPVSPTGATTGLICGRFAYALDSSFLVGGGGVDAISRASVSLNQDGPLLGVTVQNLHAEASVSPKPPFTTPATVSVVKNTTTSSTLAAAIADWAPTSVMGGGVASIAATQCYGSTYASIQLSTTSSSCTGSAAFVSLSKSYPSCVNMP
jgi:hypothetical protein